MVVSVRGLLATLEGLLGGISATHGDSIIVPQDLYWHIPAERLYDVEGVIRSMGNGDVEFLDLGSLVDDVNRLAALDHGEGEAFRYALRWASGVLRYLGEAPRLTAPPSQQLTPSSEGKVTPSREVDAPRLPAEQSGSQGADPDGSIVGPICRGGAANAFESGRRTGALEARRSTLLEFATLLAPERSPEFHACRSLTALESAVKEALKDALGATTSNS